MPDFTSLDQWFASSLGQALLETESQFLSRLLPRLFGYHLLQIDGSSVANWLKNCRIPHRIYLSTAPTQHFCSATVVGDPAELPFAPNSLDVVLIPHLLEFSPEPQQILAEAYQALIPEGHVVILGFQPWSLWGIHRILQQPRQHMPWLGNFYSAKRVRGWLTQLGYQIVTQQTLFFRPPMHAEKRLQQWFFMEAVGQLLWPQGGGVYLMVAKKKVTGVLPMPRRLRRKKLPLPHGIMQPSARVGES